MAWEEIVDFTVPSNTTSVTLNNFGTITKDDFIKATMSIVSNTTLPQKYGFYPNGNTTDTNYFNQRIVADGTSISSVRENRQYIGVNDEIGTLYISTLLKISENNKFNLFSNFGRASSNVRVNFGYQTSTVNFESGITSLTLNTSGGNQIGANSRIQIYRLTAEKVADITVTSNTTQIDITGLDIKKGDEYLLVSDVNYNSNGTIDLFVNDNITLSNYFRQAIGAAGSTPFAQRTQDARYLEGALNDRSVSYSHIKLSNIGAYTSQNYTIYRSGTNSLELYNYFISSTAENITSITKLNLKHRNTSGIGSTSRFQLYKLYEGGN